MPGVFGFLKQAEFHQQCLKSVSGVVVAQHQQHDIQLALTGLAPTIGNAIFDDDNCTIWLSGDVFSVGNVEAPELSIFAQAYRDGALKTLLAETNGYFSMMLLDKATRRLVLANDRYGLKPMYLWQDEQLLLGFGSELKYLALHPHFDVSADDIAVTMFKNVGYMLDDKTWFICCKRMLPATIIEIDLDANVSKQSHYWTWSQIHQKQVVDENECVDTLHQLFAQAVKRCINAAGNKVSLTLSGGLDSRALLAAAKENQPCDMQTFTFGNPECADAVIAKQASDRVGVENVLHTLTSDNWFDERVEGVWTTDGLMNISHMHCLSIIKEVANYSPYLLNGFLGDLVLGGSYLSSACFDRTPTIEDMAYKFGESAYLATIDQEYFRCAASDPVFIYSRGVRFTSMGSDLLSPWVHNLKPFMDSNLLDYVYSLPDELRANSSLYRKMLLKFYPALFADIPWEKTGRLISEDVAEASSSVSVTFKKRIIGAIKNTPLYVPARKLYRLLRRDNSYADYGSWMQSHSFQVQLQHLLLIDGVWVKKLIGEAEVRSILHDFSQSSGWNTDGIGALITIELFWSRLMLERGE